MSTNKDYDCWGTSELIEELCTLGDYDEDDLWCWSDSELIEEINKLNKHE